MQAYTSDAPEGLVPLESFPWQVTLPARFGDLAPGGAIEHIGMARNYEDARAAFMDHVAESAGIDRGQLHSFIVRAINEQWAPVTYPGSITVGAGAIAVGGSSFTVEMGTFQEGVCIGRSRALAVSVGENHAPSPLTDVVRAAFQARFTERSDWRAPGKPAPERRLPASYPHQLSFKTRFSDTDLLGHLNNVALLRYCDEGRAAVLLAAEDGDTAVPVGRVVRADISYLAEARVSQPITVATAIRAVEDQQVLLEQALFQGDTCVVVCDSTVRVRPGLAQRLRGLAPGP